MSTWSISVPTKRVLGTSCTFWMPTWFISAPMKRLLGTSCTFWISKTFGTFWIWRTLWISGPSCAFWIWRILEDLRRLLDLEDILDLEDLRHLLDRNRMHLLDADVVHQRADEEEPGRVMHLLDL